jgi:APA family basic amino acid/polyamine antiporter
MAAASEGREGLFATKPVDALVGESEDDAHQLQRAVGALDLTALGLGAIIGTGIFVILGEAIGDAGPAIVLSFVLAGVTCAFSALSFAELASTIPIAGSAYTYSYAVLGEVIAWIIGWDLILEYGVGAAAVSNGWSGYVVNFLQSAFGIVIPPALTASPFAAHPGILNIPAALILLLLTGLLILGTSESSRVNNVIVGVKILVVLFFIAVGVGHVNPANWDPFLPFGLTGVGAGAAIVFFAYIGFDEISTAAEEARDPQRTMPRAILLSLVICTGLYLAVAGILTGIVSYTKLNNASPVSQSMIDIGLNWAATIISVGAVAGLTTVLFTLVFGQSRIFFSMSRDGLLPRAFSNVHPRFRTPWIATLIVGIGCAILGALLPIQILAELTNIGTLSAFVLVSLAVWRLRHTHPELPRRFRTPWVPVIPILSALTAFFLIVQLPVVTMVRFLIWLAIGFALYFLYGRRHSALRAGVPPPPTEVAP